MLHYFSFCLRVFHSSLYGVNNNTLTLTLTRASAHVTFERTTSERKLCFSAKLRRQRCCLAERCLQGILPACRPIHCPRPGARASKKRTRASAHIKWLFSTKQVVSPVLTSATGAAFLVCARKQRGSAFARLRSHRQRLRPVIHTLCSRGDNQETVQPRNSAIYRRKEPERRPASFPRTTCVGVGKSRDR